MSFKKTTEQTSHYDHLEQMSLEELLFNINKEDTLVPLAVKKAIPQIQALTSQVVASLEKGGRLFYMGAGTSGRLGVVDASEIPPTFGMDPGVVIGLIAGGDRAIRTAVEFAEDDKNQGWRDLKDHQIGINDMVIGIAASGTTPYVVGALEKCNALHIATGCITCNEKSPLAVIAKYPVVAVVGPEFVTGSSRMKAGTAQKLILNMISTATMIQLGRVEGNKMVDMHLSNNKLVARAEKMLMDRLHVTNKEATLLLEKYKNVRSAIQNYKNE